jgi:hypothetical protein
LVVASASGTTVTFTTALQFDHYQTEKAKIVTPKDASAYETAISEMEKDEDKNIVVCEDNSAATV